MTSGADDLVTAGARALGEGDWAGARDAYRAAADVGRSSEALLGLASALWWLGELPESIACHEAAYAQLREADPAGAAMVAWQLSLDLHDNLGNAAAGLGWLQRAQRLADDHDLAPVQGWLLLLRAHLSTDPIACERLAGEALARARASGDVNLQLCALSQLGAALVDQGRVGEGVRLLDEAMAGSLAAEGGRPEPVVFTSCNTLQACSSCADFARAMQWLRATDRFAQRFGSPYLRADCRLHYATMLIAIGDWAQAEEELATAIAVSADALPAPHAEALAALASLRLAQGRVAEAGRLVAGLDGYPQAAAVLGGVYLAQGRPDSACAVLQRGLTSLGSDRLQAVAMRELLGEALLACDQPAAARQHADALREVGQVRDCAVAAAYGARLTGRALAAGADPAGAHTHFDLAIAAFTELGMSYEAARTRLLLAGALREHRPQAAADEARAAYAALDGLDARREADAAAAVLRRLGAGGMRGGPRRGETLTRREQEVLALLGEGLPNPEIAERLYLSRKTVEHHVARVLAKLGVRSRAEAAAEAVRSGYVTAR